MRIVLALCLIAILSAPALARGRHASPDQQQNSAEKQKQARAEEKAYKDTLRRIPNQKPADPWAKVR